jgi:drug/metabolite transporter (DMT)-like permease
LFRLAELGRASYEGPPLTEPHALSSTTDARYGAGPIAAYLAVCFVWGSTYVAIRMAVESLPPLIMVGSRSVLAGLVLVAVALGRGERVPRLRMFGPLAASSILLFVGGQSMLALGETRIASGQAAVLGALQALVMPLAAWALGAAKAPGATTWLGLLTGLAGVAVLVNPGGHVLNLLGAAAVLTSVLSWSFGGAVARRWPLGPVAMASGMQMLVGGVACLTLSLPFGAWHGFSLAAVTARSWAGFFYLASFGSLVGFSAFAWLVQIWPPARLATYTYVNPVVALVLGSAVAGEVLTLREVFATLVILGAVGVVMAGGRARQ